MIKPIAFILLLSFNLFALTAGPNSCATFASDASIGTVAWTNPGNAASSDNVRASAGPVGFPVVTQYLKATNCSFSIPAGSTINGIQLDVEETFPGTGSFLQTSVKLVVGGSITGTDQATGANLPSSEQYVTWGGASNLWGLTPSVSQVNASDFGAVFSVTQDSDPDRTIQVDHMRLTITYTAAVLGLHRMFLVFP